MTQNVDAGASRLPYTNVHRLNTIHFSPNPIHEVHVKEVASKNCFRYTFDFAFFIPLYIVKKIIFIKGNCFIISMIKIYQILKAKKKQNNINNLLLFLRNKCNILIPK